MEEQLPVGCWFNHLSISCAGAPLWMDSSAIALVLYISISIFDLFINLFFLLHEGRVVFWVEFVGGWVRKITCQCLNILFCTVMHRGSS